MIVNLRGTNGSGKSTVVTNLFKVGKVRPILGRLGPRTPEAYELTLPKVKRLTFVLGPYTSDCGGCDQVQPYESIIELVDLYAKRGHVLFESVIVTSVYGRVGAALEKYGKDAVMVFLDTSLEECIRRVQGRRDGRGDGREFNPKNLKLKFVTSVRVRKKVEEAGILRVEETNSEKGHEFILRLLQGAR